MGRYFPVSTPLLMAAVLPGSAPRPISRPRISSLAVRMKSARRIMDRVTARYRAFLKGKIRPSSPWNLMTRGLSPLRSDGMRLLWGM